MGQRNRRVMLTRRRAFAVNMSGSNWRKADVEAGGPPNAVLSLIRFEISLHWDLNSLFAGNWCGIGAHKILVPIRIS
jgi:hypothetical protein